MRRLSVTVRASTEYQEAFAVEFGFHAIFAATITSIEEDCHVLCYTLFQKYLDIIGTTTEQHYWVIRICLLERT